MSGIEAMLQSQQLTFAFVGVAPSLLVLFGLYKWVKNTLRIGTPTASSCSQKVARRRAWLALRSIDTLLASDSEPEQGQASLGYLLLELQTLREYATSNVGRGSGGKLIKKEFLKDVAVLESSVSDKTKVRAVNRIWNSFGSVLALPAMS